jgi:glycerol-3-phosphate acyltransferase PlsY
MQTTYDLVALAVGYLLGSIPFGIIITRLAGTQDIRAIGSGSTGATNVLRTGRKGLAAATLIADTLKGTAAVLVASWWCGQDHGQDLGQDCGLIAGLGAFLGHLFPVWLKFKGGKGIATGLGILLVVSWQAAIAVAIIWIVIAAASRYSSLASLIACTAAPVLLWFIGTPSQALLFLVLAVLAFIMHRGNIARLWQGTEGRIGQKA